MRFLLVGIVPDASYTAVVREAVRALEEEDMKIRGYHFHFRVCVWSHGTFNPPTNINDYGPKYNSEYGSLQSDENYKKIRIETGR